METYRIVRFHQDEHGAQLIVGGLTLEEAQAHCRRDDTRGEDWFDGYEQEDQSMSFRPIAVVVDGEIRSQAVSDVNERMSHGDKE